MAKFQKQQNEIYFKQVINSLNEGGTYILSDGFEIFIKTNNKLVAQTSKGFKLASKLVSAKAASKLFSK